MDHLFIDEFLTYDGTQLSSHFAYKNFGIAGDSIVAFIGPVNVKLTEMVDIEDVRAKEHISSDRMINFIVEVFNLDLRGTIWMQRLLMSIMCDELNRRIGKPMGKREGDDIMVGDLKLSVSIATASPVSTMIHSAINIVDTGTPIKVSCLEKLGVNPEEFGIAVLKNFSREFEEIEFARVKVNWIK